VLVGGEEGGNLTGGMNRSLRALMLSPLVSQRLAWFIAKERASDLELLAEHLEARTVTPSIGRTYPLDRVPEAIGDLVSGQVRGKVAITI
jgi:NADPH:quinone reductase-like Zn-dependent oxidoreductase